MNDVLTGMNQRLAVSSELVLDYAMLMAGISVLTVALLELIKALFNLRRKYHARCLARLLAGDTGLVQEIVEIAAAGNLKALCEQRAEAFVSSLQQAAQIVVREAKDRPELFLALTRGGALPSEPDASRGNAENRRLLRPVRVRLEAFGLSIASIWARHNQFWAVVSAAGVLFYLLGGELSQQAGVLPRVTLSILGGMAAPFAKDLVVALAGLRTRVMGGPLGGSLGGPLGGGPLSP